VTAPRGDGPARSPGASSGARGAIVIGLAVIVGIVGLQILDDSGGGSSGATGATGATRATVTTAGGTATTVGVRSNNEVRVKVYNASGVQGRAQTLTDQLRANGYNMQAPANLDKQREGTVVECMSGFEREGGVLALYGVGNGAKVVAYPSSPPAGASDADCLVVIGAA
jgi:LytR cell envelope-related transcriptional attenuator